MRVTNTRWVLQLYVCFGGSYPYRSNYSVYEYLVYVCLIAGGALCVVAESISPDNVNAAALGVLRDTPWRYV